MSHQGSSSPNWKGMSAAIIHIDMKIPANPKTAATSQEPALREASRLDRHATRYPTMTAVMHIPKIVNTSTFSGSSVTLAA